MVARSATSPETMLVDAREPDQSPLMLNVKQVASLLCVSERQVYRMTDRGLMPRPLKLGALNRWPKANLEAWLADGAKPVRN